MGQDLLGGHGATGRTAPLQHLIQLPSVIRDDGIGQESERAGDEDELLACDSPRIRAQRAGCI